ncbi:membrane protein insertion efficiency factor YidD [Candidatus Roizmanbacteria bacterium CG10_big_fil_rev_8_21_14_0_10_39_6]|uniref:Putative membrane protein insertion efficiency factor n=1 Tax=Candidatus Roizmanbacteria bacterium CG10_big_fil_rev_8_21_14_0_10_39_6 TaxID=1974853 RepID=A0A2M8KTK6_9BACT|nr:MAG: membrane protein insertion efficiency factor YidD [Candidatus Roizmanbacteria bacterium CG10_big_fil_rev_8_21_14_0_10_39_6]
MIRRVIIGSIRVYVWANTPLRTLLKVIGLPSESCRFQPTCSQYSIEAVQKYGALKGLYKGIVRIFRCNPWSKGGFDPLK